MALRLTFQIQAVDRVVNNLTVAESPKSQSPKSGADDRGIG